MFGGAILFFNVYNSYKKRRLLNLIGKFGLRIPHEDYVYLVERYTNFFSLFEGFPKEKDYPELFTTEFRRFVEKNELIYKFSFYFLVLSATTVLVTSLFDLS